MDCNRIRRAAAFAVVIAHDQEVTEAVHTFVLESGVEVRERFKQLVVPISFTFKSVLQQYPVPIFEMLLIQLSAVSIKKDVAMIFGYCP
jgi:hypothetical protein